MGGSGGAAGRAGEVSTAPPCARSAINGSAALSPTRTWQRHHALAELFLKHDDRPRRQRPVREQARQHRRRDLRTRFRNRRGGEAKWERKPDARRLAPLARLPIRRFASVAHERQATVHHTHSAPLSPARTRLVRDVGHQRVEGRQRHIQEVGAHHLQLVQQPAARSGRRQRRWVGLRPTRPSPLCPHASPRGPLHDALLTPCPRASAAPRTGGRPAPRRTRPPRPSTGASSGCPCPARSRTPSRAARGALRRRWRVQCRAIAAGAGRSACEARRATCAARTTRGAALAVAANDAGGRRGAAPAPTAAVAAGAGARRSPRPRVQRPQSRCEVQQAAAPRATDAPLQRPRERRLRIRAAPRPRGAAGARFCSCVHRRRRHHRWCHVTRATVAAVRGALRRRRHRRGQPSPTLRAHAPAHPCRERQSRLAGRRTGPQVSQWIGPAPVAAAVQCPRAAAGRRHEASSRRVVSAPCPRSSRRRVARRLTPRRHAKARL